MKPIHAEKPNHKRVRGLIKVMRDYQAKGADCPFHRPLLAFGIAALEEMSRRGITVEEFNQTHLSDLSAYPHALPCALYYFELNGDNFREHRHRVADILGIEPVEEYQLLWVKMHPDFQRPALQRLAA